LETANIQKKGLIFKNKRVTDANKKKKDRKKERKRLYTMMKTHLTEDGPNSKTRNPFLP
jgi:hypothetical protein